jgi:hypothetical protein
VIISDMTGRNPNVFYETGYAHGLGKQVILITQQGEDIPFDLKHCPHIIYGGRITVLKPELQRRVEWAVANPQGRLTTAEPTLQLYSGGRLIRDSGIVRIVGQIPNLQIDIYNPGPAKVEGNVNLAIISSDYRGFIQTSKPLSSPTESTWLSSTLYL